MFHCSDFSFSDSDNDFGSNAIALTWLLKSIHSGRILNPSSQSAVVREFVVSLNAKRSNNYTVQ